MKLLTESIQKTLLTQCSKKGHIINFNKIYVELTNICGLSCSFCPTQKPPTKTLSLEEFENILQQIKPYTKVITYHMFGDPLTLSNLQQYLDITQKNGLKVEIVTTGYYLAKFDLETFLHPAIRQINFSLNSFNKNDMGISLDKYLEPMFNLCDLKLKKKVHNFINFRLWNLDSKISEDCFNQDIYRLLEKQFSIKLDNIDSSKPIRLENQILLDFDNYFQWPSLDLKNDTNGTCYGLQSHIGILSDGTVVPCCLDCNGIIQLGNIHQTNLKEILASQKAQNIINGFKKGESVELLCKKCTFKNRFNEELSKG